MKSTFFILPLILLFFCACKKDIGQVNFGNYPHDIGNIIRANCATAGCHNNASYIATNGFNMQTWEAMFQGSNNGSPVIPYSSKFSSMCYFINTYAALGNQNIPTMPLNKALLSYTQVKLIKDWIDAGAPDINGNIMWSSNPLRKKFYAVNQGCSVVTVFDAETKLPMRYINVGTKGGTDTPHFIKISPDGAYWYVIFVNNNIMQKFRCSDDSYVGSVPLSPLAAGTGTFDALNWNTFTITNDGKKAFCVSWQPNGVVCSVDLVNMKLLNFVGGLNSPHGICLDNNNQNIYITALSGNCLTQFDTSFTTSNQLSMVNGQLPSDFNNQLQVHDVMPSPFNTDQLLVTCQKTNEVRVFSIASNSVIAVVPTGIYPQHIAHSMLRNQFYVSCAEDTSSFPHSRGTITKIDALTLSPTKIAVGWEPHGLAVDDENGILYVLSRNITGVGVAPHHSSNCAGRNGFVDFVNLNTFSLTGIRYELSVDPYFISERP
ncbi:MAG: hypothetical protein JSU07_04835 [Bacteroidetes bacterium]|nr:hypothetical protein [Bacteroidota bacterium]